MKIKGRNRCKLNHCTECFMPTHLKFNFSFMKYDDDFTSEHKIALIDRIEKLSNPEYQIIAGWDKKIGFETIDIPLNKQMLPGFARSDRKYDNKYTVFRLYPNNNPLPSRIIGKLINKIFYILFIDIKGKYYH